VKVLFRDMSFSGQEQAGPRDVGPDFRRLDPPMGSFGFEAAVMAPVAVSPDTDISVKSTVPVLPQPAAGASGQVDLSAYVSRP
jgi:hypothetical protein